MVVESVGAAGALVVSGDGALGDCVVFEGDDAGSGSGSESGVRVSVGSDQSRMGATGFQSPRLSDCALAW